jgi:hypothetical protein
MSNRFGSFLCNCRSGSAGARQAQRQVAAAGERAIRWYFSEKQAADYVRELFRGDRARDRIDIVHVPMPDNAR